MSYTVKRQFIGKTEFLDSLMKESGKLYSQTLTYFWRIVKKKNIWLKPKHLMRIFNSKNLHAHSADAAVQAFFNALSSWREHKKSDPNCKPPKKRKLYYPITWKNSAIRIKNNNLILSNGKGNQPLILENWKYKLPKICLMRWTGKKYEIIFTYSEPDSEINIKQENPVGIDIGQIHLAACSNGLLVNGRELRSLKQWRNKKLSDLQTKLSTKKKGSRQWKRLNQAKKNFLMYFKNRSNDILHKLSTGIVLTQKKLGVNTLVIGDLSGYRQDNNCGKIRNQENHQWLYGKITFYLKYKAENNGLIVRLQEESYTSQTCPRCGNKKKMKGRVFYCEECGFSGHRDIVGSYNILRKYLGTFNKYQVVTDMAPVFSIRYKSNINVACGFKNFLSSKLQESTGF